jgi:FKBP-type peptidyl-prolyl cis-trans isomerase FklB
MRKHTGTLILGTCGLLALAGGLASTACAQAPTAADSRPAAVAADPAAPTADQAGYAYGVNFGQQLAALGITKEIPAESIMRGLKAGLAGKKTSPEDIVTVQAFVTSLRAAMVATNSAAAKEFLDRNVGQKGVKATPSGLQYKVLAPGDAKQNSPRATDVVSVQYRGRLIDGSEFDSSYAHGKAATFALTGVIKGWQEALQMMKPGAKWQIFVPPDLAYGGIVKPGIPAGSLLIFDLELLNVSASSAAN